MNDQVGRGVPPPPDWGTSDDSPFGPPPSPGVEAGLMARVAWLEDAVASLYDGVARLQAGAAVHEQDVLAQDSFDVVLETAGDKKIQVIKEIRTLTNLGLKEAKDLVDGAPKPILKGVDKEAADKAKATLEGVGATVTLR